MVYQNQAAAIQIPLWDWSQVVWTLGVCAVIGAVVGTLTGLVLK